MKILDKYIAKQIFLAVMASMILFIVVWVSPEILLKIIKRTLEGSYTIEMAIQLFCLEIPDILGKALPVSFLLGGLFVFDKLSNDFELIIFRSIGISFKRIIVPIVCLSLFASGICFYVYDKLIPYSENKMKQVKHEVSDSYFVYVDKTKEGKPNKIMIVSYYNPKEIKNVNVLEFSKGVSADTPMMKNILIGHNATYKNKNWYIQNGKSYNISNHGVFDSISNFDTIKFLDGENGQNAFNLMLTSLKRDKELNNSQLYSYAKLLKQEGLMDEHRFMLNKFYQRIFHSLSCVFLAICGAVLGFSKPRQQRLLGFTIGVGIIFAYYLVIPFLDLMAEKGVLLPIISASLPCILIAITTYSVIKTKDI